MGVLLPATQAFSRGETQKRPRNEPEEVRRRSAEKGVRQPGSPAALSLKLDVVALILRTRTAFKRRSLLPAPP